MDGTELLLHVNLMQEFLFGNSNELVLHQYPVSLVAGLSFLPKFIVRALATVAVIFSWSGGDYVQVGPDIEPVNHDIVVTLPWHHSGGTLSCCCYRRIDMDFGNSPMYL